MINQQLVMKKTNKNITEKYELNFAKKLQQKEFECV